MCMHPLVLSVVGYYTGFREPKLVRLTSQVVVCFEAVGIKHISLLVSHVGDFLLVGSSNQFWMTTMSSEDTSVA